MIIDKIFTSEYIINYVNKNLLNKVNRIHAFFPRRIGSRLFLKKSYKTSVIMTWGAILT